MEHQGIIISCIAILAIVVITAFVLKRRSTPAIAGDAKSTPKGGGALASVEKSQALLQFEESLPLSDEEEQRIVKIEDTRLLAEIDRAIPVAAHAAVNADAAAKVGKAVEAHNKAAESAGQLYRAIIPKGTELADSQAMEGAKRGIFHAERGIKGHANLVPVEQQQIDPNLGQELAAANVAGSVMNIASLVVGQYYMAQINGRLESVEEGIGKISEFQNVEYRSAVYALVAAVKKSSTFRFEVMENDELRIRELSYLKERENECAKLLGHANITIEQISKKRGLDFDGYEAAVRTADSWWQYQQVLLQVMTEIAELTYTLNRGALSRENSYALLLPYASQAESSFKKLSAWHGDYMSKLEIDTKSSRRRRQGIDAALHAIPALFEDDFHYKEISSRTTKMIRRQRRSTSTAETVDELDLYQEDVTLIMKDGAMYYLPPAEES
ncbi:MAG: hypothetical protein PUH96_10125 [Coriobacteriaceae bacterium]|nr:hypothetical protein [Coriobacteriaceae bacterium]